MEYYNYILILTCAFIVIITFSIKLIIINIVRTPWGSHIISVSIFLHVYSFIFYFWEEEIIACTYCANTAVAVSLCCMLKMLEKAITYVLVNYHGKISVSSYSINLASLSSSIITRNFISLLQTQVIHKFVKGFVLFL